MSYPYTKADLLQEPPQHYMYSAYQGARLLAAYTADRNHAMARLDAVAGRSPGETFGNDPGRAPPRVPPRAPTGPFEATELLRDLAAYAGAGGDLSASPASGLLEAFIGKFEVAKRLRKSYGPNLKPAGAEHAGPAAYAYLAYAAAVAARQGGPHRLRHLNALLKLDDTIASTDLDRLDRAALAAARAAMGLELDLVQQLAADKGISWPDGEKGAEAGLVA